MYERKNRTSQMLAKVSMSLVSECMNTLKQGDCNGHILSFSSYLISASILSNHSACLISLLIYGCGLVSSSRTFWYVPLHSDVIDDIT